MPNNHSYEEIWTAACDVLANREQTPYSPTQYENLANGVAAVFSRRDGQYAVAPSRFPNQNLSPQDADVFLEVFWALFRQGIITLGSNSSNTNFPFCRLSHLGKAIIENQHVYFFHDVSTYEATVRKEVPTIDEITLLYLKEAMQAFRSGCILSATVMLGVAAEQTFTLLLETVDSNTAHSATYAAVNKERGILRKSNKFWTILQKHVSGLPSEVKEDLETNFIGIQAVIRNFRNESGHPTGKIVDREQAYVLLNLMIPYLKKMRQLIATFA